MLSGVEVVVCESVSKGVISECCQVRHTLYDPPTDALLEQRFRGNVPQGGYISPLFTRLARPHVGSEAKTIRFVA
jgi:hypothetical protein